MRILMKKILIINNHEDTMSLIQRFLQKNAFKAEYVYRAQGGDVIEKIKEYEPDLVILESSIGEEGPLCERIKSNGNTNIPVILMTGNISTERGFEHCGADDIIAKPFEPKLLLKKIAGLLNNK